MTQTAALRRRSEQEASHLPPLLARAERLAGTILLGEHGRRRAGMGDDFWQYRPMQAGDELRQVDWRRSAKGDQQFIRQREWQIAQSVVLWVDQAASMRFRSGDQPTKADRARVIALALSVLLIRGGERVGLTGTVLPPRRGQAQVHRLAEQLSHDDDADYAVPEARAMIPNTQAVFVSDFLAPLEGIERALTKAADRGVGGVLLQVLDPAEEAFPYQGRTVFQSMNGTLTHETLKAGDLRDRYRKRLSERKANLGAICAATGWQYQFHRTDQTAQAALLWLYQAMDQGGR